MEDFLKDRPTLSADEARLVAPVRSTPGSPQLSAFSQIRREPARPPEARPGAAPAAAVSAPGVAAAQQLTGEHGTRVQTIVERGRVTRIVVTCACGKVTEIACVY